MGRVVEVHLEWIGVGTNIRKALIREYPCQVRE